MKHLRASKNDQLLDSADRALADGYSVHFGHTLGGDGKADYALYDCQNCAPAVLETKITTAILSSGKALDFCYASQSSCVRRYR